MQLLLGAVVQGVCFALLAWGVYLSLRVLKFPDITVDGTLTLGAAVLGVLVAKGQNPYVAIVAAFGAGCVAGTVTGLIHTRLGVADLLAGILTMTALYSINLRVMGRSNVPVLEAPLGLPAGAAFALLALGIGLGFVWFMRTDYGLSLRATGDNSTMAAANAVDVRTTKMIGLALANGFAAVGGAMLAIIQGFADITMGVGALVTGIASVVLGEALRLRGGILLAIVGALVGAILFRCLIALALMQGMEANDMKLVTAVFVLIALALPKVLERRRA